MDVATLADRLLAEAASVDGCVIYPPMTGAWALRPASSDREARSRT